LEDPTFDYSASTYCLDVGSIPANVTGTAGGTFSSSAGISLNPSTGEITSGTSTPGSYTITYTTPDPTCFTSSTFTVELYEVPTVNAGLDTAICIGDLIAVQATGAPTLDWDNNAADGVPFSPDTTMMYTVIGTNGGGCTGTDSVLITVMDLPIMTISPDTAIDHETWIQLYATGGVTYSWDPSQYLSCDDCPNPIATPEEDTYYCVTTTDANGCVNDTCVMINIIINCGEVFVPSGFSPNGDGENDELCVYSNCWDQLTLRVFNRWGELVFENSSETICWDGTWNGKPLNPAVFVYTVDGFLINGQTVSQKGNITIVK
jgi:gliding motility-associated-like protein